MKRLCLILLLLSLGVAAQELRRPTTDVVCGNYGTTAALANAYDSGGPATSSILSVTGGPATSVFANGSDNSVCREVYGIAAPSAAYTALTLKVRIDSDVSGLAGGSVEVSYRYTGTSFTYLCSLSGTCAVTLPAGTNLANIRVQITVTGNGGQMACDGAMGAPCYGIVQDGYGPSTASATVYDVWTEGTLPVARQSVRVTATE